MKTLFRTAAILICLIFGFLISHSCADEPGIISLRDQAAYESAEPKLYAASNVKRTIWRRRRTTPSDTSRQDPRSQDMPAFGADRPSSVPTQPLPSAPSVRMEDIKVSGEGEKAKISLEIKGMDILDVLKLLAKKSGLNIVAGRNVRGNVTIFLRDVEIWDALLIILETYDLAYERKGLMIKVMTDADYQRLHGTPFHDIRTVKFVLLDHAKAGEVSQELNLIKTKIGKIIINDRTNMLVLIDTPAGIEAMTTVISEFDIPVATKVFELEYTDVLSIEEKIKDLLSATGKLTLDISTNKIIVTDSAMNVNSIEKLVREYDVATKLVTRMYHLNYAIFSEVEEKVADILTKDIGKIVSDERTSTITVTDLMINIPRVDNLVRILDQKEKQVMIDAKIIQVQLNDEFQMGINWEALFEGEFGGLNWEHMFSKTISAGTTLAFGVIDAKGVLGAIQFLKTVGKTNLLAEPRIVTINNKTASIHVGTNEAYITSDVTQNDNTTTITPNVEFQQVGIKLSVTPRINEEGFILMEVKPEVSSVARVVELFNDRGQKISEVPIVKTTETETTVLVKSGKTLILGGLIDDTLAKNENRVPIIGTIPILGAFFRNRDKKLDKFELIVFITPTIISGGEDLVPQDEAEHERMLRLKTILDRMKKFDALRKKTNKILSGKDHVSS